MNIFHEPMIRTIDIRPRILSIEQDINEIKLGLNKLEVLNSNMISLEKLEKIIPSNIELYELTYGIIKENLVTRKTITMENDGFSLRDMGTRLWKRILMLWERVKANAEDFYNFIAQFFQGAPPQLDILEFGADYESLIEASSLNAVDSSEMLALMEKLVAPRESFAYKNIQDNFSVDREDLIDAMRGTLHIEIFGMNVKFTVGDGRITESRSPPKTAIYYFKDIMEIKYTLEQGLNNAKSLMNVLTSGEYTEEIGALKFQTIVDQITHDYKTIFEQYQLAIARIQLTLYVMDSVKAGKQMPVEKHTELFLEKI